MRKKAALEPSREIETMAEDLQDFTGLSPKFHIFIVEAWYDAIHVVSARCAHAHALRDLFRCLLTPVENPGMTYIFTYVP